MSENSRDIKEDAGILLRVIELEDSVVNRIMAPPKDAHVLIFKACEYVIHGKRNFPRVIKDIRIGRLSWIILAGPV